MLIFAANLFTDIVNATINPIKVKDKCCFELSAAIPGKKGNKKYVFAAENEYDRDKWVEALKKLSVPQNNPEEEGINPVIANAQPTSVYSKDDDEDDATAADPSQSEEEPASSTPSRSQSNTSMSNSMRSSVIPLEMSGYLQKKSPAMMKGWQKRYFKTLSNGDIAYFKDVSIHQLVYFSCCNIFEFRHNCRRKKRRIPTLNRRVLFDFPILSRME
jgi:hypothetical protein